MTIAEILQRDPTATSLVNNGQARIGDETTEKEWDELRGELSTFVCEGQYADGILRILESYLGGLTGTSQKGAWVSGFYGSGKSHLLKMLCHLWQNTDLPGDGPARNIVPSLPSEIQAQLRELDTAGKRAGGLLAAAGALPSGTSDHVRLTVLGIVFRACGLPAQYAQGRFSLWLHEEGHYSAVRTAVEKAGRTWDRELNDIYVSPTLRRALLECDTHFAANEGAVRDVLHAQFPKQSSDITTAEFLDLSKRALRLAGKNEQIPCTILVLDEAQQYIGDSHDRSRDFTEVTEALEKQFDARVMVVAAGQSALSQVEQLGKLLDRYTIRVALSDTDVDTVTRKVVLQKKPAAKAAVRELLDTHSGEISRQLHGTRIAERAEDREIAIDDYPLLPARRRFWDHCFRAIDQKGTSSQLRSQLRILHDAVKDLAGRELGALIPGDELYKSLAPEMLQTGALPREISDRIVELAKDGTADSVLKSRICGLIFLIQSLPTEAVADTGVRATKDHIADLLIDDLAADNGKLRHAVSEALAALIADAKLMQLGDEYRLQTREGAEWEQDFRKRRARLSGDDGRLHELRDKALHAEFEKRRASVKIHQGASRVMRPFAIAREASPPASTSDAIPLWLRDGWGSSEKDILAAARSAGPTSPLIFAWIPRNDEDIKNAILDAAAAEDTLNARGVPGSDEGKHARESMRSRMTFAELQRNAVVAHVVGGMKVFQAGGAEVAATTVEQKLRDAADVSVMRMFPRFKDADSGGWERVIKLAHDGADKPLAPVGHDGLLEQHPVCQQVLVSIGGGKVGTEMRKELKASPYGWPQEAIDAVLMCLHNSQHITATLNGTPVPQRQLDHNKIARAEFRVEHVTLSASDKITLRELLRRLDINAKNEDLAAKASEFVSAAQALAREAGGDPPLPLRPVLASFTDLGGAQGNDLLATLLERAPDLTKQIAALQATKAVIVARQPSWEMTERLARHAATLPELADVCAQVDAIRSNRLLLDATDPVPPLRAALSGALRKAVSEADAAIATAYAEGLALLETNAMWQELSPPDRVQVLATAGLTVPVSSPTATDDALVAALDARSLTTRHDEALAIDKRIANALAAAAKSLEPTVRNLALARATLRNDADVRAWLAEQETVLLDAVKTGPILVS